MILCLILLVYYHDLKTIGKENLAVPLIDRLKAYFLIIILPMIIGLLK